MVFTSTNAHTAFHFLKLNEDYLIPCEDGSYDCVNPNSICPSCGGSKSIYAKTCRVCKTLAYQPVSDPATIISDIFEARGNMVLAARKYGITDNALRKRLRRHNLPTHSNEWRAIIRSVAQSGESPDLINRKPLQG